MKHTWFFGLMFVALCMPAVITAAKPVPKGLYAKGYDALDVNGLMKFLKASPDNVDAVFAEDKTPLMIKLVENIRPEYLEPLHYILDQGAELVPVTGMAAIKIVFSPPSFDPSVKGVGAVIAKLVKTMLAQGEDKAALKAYVEGKKKELESKLAELNKKLGNYQKDIAAYQRELAAGGHPEADMEWAFELQAKEAAEKLLTFANNVLAIIEAHKSISMAPVIESHYGDEA